MKSTQLENLFHLAGEGGQGYQRLSDIIQHNALVSIGSFARVIIVRGGRRTLLSAGATGFPTTTSRCLQSLPTSSDPGIGSPASLPMAGKATCVLPIRPPSRSSRPISHPPSALSGLLYTGTQAVPLKFIMPSFDSSFHVWQPGHMEPLLLPLVLA